MRFPWADLLLALVIVIGGVRLWHSATERARSQPEYERLRQRAGELIPTDPSQVYVRAIPTGDRLDFAWRVYFPPNYPIMVRHTSGSSSSGSGSQPVNAIVRVRLREDDGAWRVYYRFPFTSGLSSIDPRAGEFLRKHPDRLQVEQFGRDRTEQLDPSVPFVLLRLTAPEKLESEGDSLSSDLKELSSRPIVELKVGPPR